MAKTENKTGYLAMSADELRASGVDHVNDLGDGLVEVFGIKGDYIVVANDDAEQLTPAQRQTAVDLSLEHSKNGKNDPRHSEHPDFARADGVKASSLNNEGVNVVGGGSEDTETKSENAA